MLYNGRRLETYILSPSFNNGRNNNGRLETLKRINPFCRINNGNAKDLAFIWSNHAGAIIQRIREANGRVGDFLYIMRSHVVELGDY